MNADMLVFMAPPGQTNATGLGLTDARDTDMSVFLRTQPGPPGPPSTPYSQADIGQYKTLQSNRFKIPYLKYKFSSKYDF